MMLRTHVVFTWGLVSLVTAVTHSGLSIVLAFFTSVLGNFMIDGLGHEEVVEHGRVYMIRSPTTHTPARAALWGLAGSVLTAFAFNVLVQVPAVVTLAAILSGVPAGLSHLLLDALTEHGIYVERGGRLVRWSVANMRYNDPLGNGLAVAMGVLMLLISLSLL